MKKRALIICIYKEWLVCPESIGLRCGIPMPFNVEVISLNPTWGSFASGGPKMYHCGHLGDWSSFEWWAGRVISAMCVCNAWVVFRQWVYLDSRVCVVIVGRLNFLFKNSWLHRWVHVLWTESEIWLLYQVSDLFDIVTILGISVNFC